MVQHKTRLLQRNGECIPKNRNAKHSYPDLSRIIARA